jgi:PAS domain S-box-containing protein
MFLGDAAMVVSALSLVLNLISSALSAGFVLRRRLGAVWLLVTAGLLVMAATEAVFLRALYLGEETLPPDVPREGLILAFSVLVFGGFSLTERWFRIRERLEARALLFRDVERALVGLLEEDRILDAVCRTLGEGKGCLGAWVGSKAPDGSIRTLLAAGCDADSLSSLSLRWDGAGYPLAPGDALRTGKVAVSGPGECDAALPRGKGRRKVRHVAAVPVRLHGEISLVLSVIIPSRRGLDPFETASLEALGGRLEAALESARRHEYFACAKRAYDEVLKAQRDGTVLVRGGVIVRANPAALSLLGYGDFASIEGKDAAVLVDESGQDGAEAAACLRTGSGDGGRRKWEVSARRSDGTTFPCEMAVTYLPRKGWHERYPNALTGDLGMVVLHDLSDHRLAYAEIARQRDFIATILRISGILVVQADPAGAILLFNGKSEETTGYPALRAVGKEMAALLVSAGHRGAWRRAFVEASMGKEVGRHEFPLQTASGEERQVLWNIAALRDGGGKVSSVVATGMDVTDRKSLERQITEMQKMEAVGTLAGGVAHDFNNLLTGILGNLEMAEALVSPDSPEGRAMAESLRATERAAQLVRQLLDFSRRSPIETRPTPIPPLLGEVRGLLSQSIDRRIALAVESPPSLPPVLADPGRIHQVLVNLCVNARDAILERIEKEGGGNGHIVVRGSEVVVDEEYLLAYPYARAGRFVLLEIRDDGNGMDEAVQRRIFEPFFTTKRLGRGTGLGLSTVYGIVKQHDGWINLESAPGEGTVFRVYLPVAHARPAAPALAPDPGAGGKGRERILVVDDESMIRDLATQVLGRRGYEVTTAVDGLEALDLFGPSGDRFDLVILDQTMPNLTGIEVLREIRERVPAAKVILSSGYTLPQVPKGVPFLQKPYRVETLARLVRDVLDHRQS